MKEINDFLTAEFHKQLNKYYEILLKVFDSLNVLHQKRKISLTLTINNGKISIHFRGKIYYIEMPVINHGFSTKITHSQLQELLLNIVTLKEIKSEIDNFKEQTKGIQPTLNFNE